MIVYSGNKASFQRDALNGILARRIDETFRSLGIPKESYAEFKSWENSLPRIYSSTTTESSRSNAASSAFR